MKKAMRVIKEAHNVERKRRRSKEKEEERRDKDDDTASEIIDRRHQCGGMRKEEIEKRLEDG